MNYPKEIAKVLVEIGAVGFVPEKPITFKSGLVSPIYIDNRIFPYYPHAWSLVIQAMEEKLMSGQIQADVIAGIATAGIPHSAALGYAMVKPSIFIRKESKGHGTEKLVEGGQVKGKQVVLVEDHITTGGSSLKGVKAIQAEEGTVKHCLAITSYGFAEAEKAFKQAGVELVTLTTFEHILNRAVASGALTIDQQKVVKDWLDDPKGWKAGKG